MAVAKDALGTEQAQNPSTGTLTYNGLTVVSNSNAAIVIGFVFDATASANGAQINIVTGYTKIITGASPTSGWRLEMWGKAGGISIGLQTITFNTNLSVAGNISIAAMSVTGANQTGGTTTFANGTSRNSAGEVNASVIVPMNSGANDLVVAFIAINNEATGTNQTNIYSNTALTPSSFANYAQNPGGSSVTMATTGGVTNSEDIALGVDIVPPAVQSSGGTMPLMGVGRRRSYSFPRDRIFMPKRKLILPIGFKKAA